MTSALFDRRNPNWSDKNGVNYYFLESEQHRANEKLESRGFLTLNEVYDMLGLEMEDEGALAGWVGDVEVDFGIRGVIGGEGPIELHFNPNSMNVFRNKQKKENNK